MRLPNLGPELHPKVICSQFRHHLHFLRLYQKTFSSSAGMHGLGWEVGAAWVNGPGVQE